MNQTNEAPQPAWKMLNADMHLSTLSHSYAPAGLLEMIATPPRRVFDLGCFVGGSGRWLKEKFPEVYLAGAELLPKAAAKAQEIYDEVFVGRFEDLPLDAHAGRYDAIIAADVLEHLYNPWQALERLKTLLAAGGALYVSLPNVRNLRIIEGLVSNGDWPYAGAGILDITHIRFFTRQSALRMLAETDWRVEEVRANLDPALRPSIEGKDLSSIQNINLDKLSLSQLQAHDTLELFTLQWFFRCLPAGVYKAAAVAGDRTVRLLGQEHHLEPKRVLEEGGGLSMEKEQDCS